MKDALTADERRTCNLMGVDPHDYLATRDQERAILKARNQEEASASPADAAKIAKMMGVSPAEAKAAKKKAAKEDEARAALTSEELKICHQLGVQPLEYWAQKMEAAGLKTQLPA